MRILFFVVTTALPATAIACNLIAMSLNIGMGKYGWACFNLFFGALVIVTKRFPQILLWRYKK